jgi:hypothetical protein
LLQSGDAGVKVATARIPSALPEMKDAIERFLTDYEKGPMHPSIAENP